MQLIDAEADLLFSGGSAGIVRTQEITDSYLDGLAQARMVSDTAKLPESYRVASIPAALVETWQRQGFDVYRESAAAICARLRVENLQAFLTTDRKI